MGEWNRIDNRQASILTEIDKLRSYVGVNISVEYYVKETKKLLRELNENKSKVY